MPTEIGVLAVRRSVLIRATPERVWQEFESYERMRKWYGVGHHLASYEPKIGAEVVTTVVHEGEPLRFVGKVLVYDPPRELTFEQDWPGKGWAAPPMITIRLTAALGGTLVELFHHAIERTGPDAAEQHLGFENGWTPRHLEALRAIVEA